MQFFHVNWKVAYLINYTRQIIFRSDYILNCPKWTDFQRFLIEIIVTPPYSWTLIMLLKQASFSSQNWGKDCLFWLKGRHILLDWEQIMLLTFFGWKETYLLVIGVECGGSGGKSETDETPQGAQANEEAWRSPAESVRMKQKSPVLFLKKECMNERSFMHSLSYNSSNFFVEPTR